MPMSGVARSAPESGWTRDDLTKDPSIPSLNATLSARFFPNASPTAYYSPYDLAVHMPAEAIDAARVGDSAYRTQWIRDRHFVLIHEYQHSGDHLGTVVGRRLLDGLFGALYAHKRSEENDISELWRLMRFHDLQRRFFRRGYYTVNARGYRPAGPDRPRWLWEPSVGAAFDASGRIDEDQPIFFLRFSDVDTGGIEPRIDILKRPPNATILDSTSHRPAPGRPPSRTCEGRPAS